MSDQRADGGGCDEVESLIQELRRQATPVSDPHIGAQLEAIAGEWERRAGVAD